MVDVGPKAATRRVAIAQGIITMQPQTLALIESGSAAKGDVMGIARIAGIQLIPLCHPIMLTHVSVDLDVQQGEGIRPPSVLVRATAETTGPTGVEMEALTAVQVALLTIYDMCKAADRGMRITDVRLIEKRGGKSGDWRADSSA